MLSECFLFPPNLDVEILISKDDNIRRWGLWEMLKSWAQSPHERDWCPYKHETPQPLSPREDIERRHWLWTRKGRSQKRNDADAFISDFQRPAL